MDDVIKKIAKDVEEIRRDQIELIKQGAVHNSILKQHEARSLAIQEQVKLDKITLEEQRKSDKAELKAELKPVTSHVTFVNNVAKLMGVVAGGVGFMYYAVSLFFKLKG